MAEAKILMILFLGFGLVLATPAMAEDASEKEGAVEDDEIETEDGVETEDATQPVVDEASVNEKSAEPKEEKKAKKKKKKKKKKKSKASLLLPVSQKGAIVLVDGEQVGQTPLAPVTGLTVGIHTVEVTKDGFYTASIEVDLPKDGLIREDIMLETTSSSSAKVPKFMKTWWFWTAVGVVVATGATVGIYYGVKEDPPDAVPLPPY